MPTERADDFVVNIHKAVRDLGLVEKYKKTDDRGRPSGWGFTLNIIDNPYLMYNRLIPQSETADNKKEDKTKFLDAIVKRLKKIEKFPFVKDYLKRQKAILQSYEHQGWQAEHLEMTTDWRLVAGLGNESVLETSLSLHPLYGFPYIPGSSVKGVARAYAQEVYWESNKIKDTFFRVFGSAPQEKESSEREDANDNRVGEVIFFDALPEKFDGNFLDLDVMTPHYGEYYSDGETPGDWMQPNPITFLTVAPGRKFMFSLAAKEKPLFETAQCWLKMGLQELGAGGKTSAGYGYFRVETESRSGGESEKKKPVARTLSPLPKNALEAEVVDVNSRPLRVRLIDSDEIVPMGGISNPAGLKIENGTKLYVEPNIDKKTKRIQSVRRIRNV